MLSRVEIGEQVVVEEGHPFNEILQQTVRIDLSGKYLLLEHRTVHRIEDGHQK